MEHLHVILNHFPVIGLVMGIFALTLAFFLRSRPAQVVGIAVIFVAALSTFPVNYTGQQSYKPMRALTDDGGTDWLDEHMERAEKLAPAFYILAALSAAALFVPRKWPRTQISLTIATFVLTAACAGASGWIALAGGQIRHPEFRTHPAPENSMEPHHH